MAKDKFLKKLHPSRSFAGRVFLICLSLLIVPLLFHSFFLYQRELRQKIEEVATLLETIGGGEKALLEEIIEADWRTLEVVSGDIGAHAKSLHIVETDLPPGAGRRFAVPNARTESLLIGIAALKNRAYAIRTPYKELIDRLSHFEKTPYPTSLAILSGEGDLLAGEIQPDAITAQFPLHEADIALLLSVPKGAIREIHERVVLGRFLMLLLFIGLIGGSLVWLLTKRVGKPLKNLCTAMQRVSEGAVHIRYTPDPMGFEINELGKQFNQTLDALLEQQQEAERERIGREKLVQEFRIGHDIQSSLFPTRIPELEDLDIAPGYLPAREVGGDFYDLLLLENGTLFIAIADTAGKGISACLYSLGLRSSLRSFASITTDLSEIILRANDLFWSDAKNTGMFVTLWAAIYDPKTRKLTYCSQGHAPALLHRGGKLEELTTHGIALGAQKLDAVTTDSVALHIHDLLFLYTDGLIEAHDIDEQLFGSKRLREFLSRNGKSPSAQLIEKLLEEIHLFSQGMAQHDDLTALAVRIFR